MSDQQEDDDDDDDGTDVSLITGALRSQNLNRQPSGPSSGSSVVLRNQTLTVANTSSAGRTQSPAAGVQSRFIGEFHTNTTVFLSFMYHSRGPQLPGRGPASVHLSVGSEPQTKRDIN